MGDHKWILPSLREFRTTSRYAHLDIGYIQPVSSVNLDWVEQKLLTDLEYDKSQLERIRKKYLDHDQNHLHDPRLAN